MTGDRGKALERCCKMLRMAEDGRTPAGERAAARNRFAATCERWGITEQEIAAHRRRSVRREHVSAGAAAAARRAAFEAEMIRRRQAAAAAAFRFATNGNVMNFGPRPVISIVNGQIVIQMI